MALQGQDIAVDDPVVFELAGIGGGRQEVVLRLPSALQVVAPTVRIEPPVTPQGFRFSAGRPEWSEVAEHPETVRLGIDVTCEGGTVGAEDAAVLTVTFETGDEVAVRLIASRDHVAPFSEILHAEYRELRPGWAPDLDAVVGPAAPPADEEAAGAPRLRAQEDAALRRLYGVAHASPTGLAALCLSGGGIRSATFNLGVLQAFASLGLLGRFDYLSTVSGGGYIGGWLSGWLRREESATVLAQLAGAHPEVTRPEAEPLRHLRDYSNYLTPRLGLFSADTWTLAAIVIRNLLLNWLVIVPVLAALLAVPLFAVAELPGYGEEDQMWLFAAAFGLGVVGLFFMSLLRASRPPAERGGDPPGAPWEQRFLPLGLAPLLAGTACLVLAVRLFDPRGAFPFFDALPYGLLWGLVMPLAALLLSAAAHPLVFPGRSRRTSLAVDVSAVAMSGAVVGVVYAALLHGWVPLLLAPAHRHLHLYEIFAPGLTLGPLLLGKMLFIAFTSPAESWWRGRLAEQGDADREWWARWSGWVLIVCVAWIALSGLVFFSPFLLREGLAQAGAAVAAGGFGALASWLGKSALTGGGVGKGDGERPSGWRTWALALAAPLFCVLLLLMVSAGTQALLERAETSLQEELLPVEVGADEAMALDAAVPWAQTAQDAPAAAKQGGLRWRTTPAAHPPFHGPLWMVAAAIAGLFGFANLLGYAVNVNRFSLQGMYRNRLVRAYLGASHAGRQANPFTGFDPADNLRLADLRRNRPFHVVNTTLNLVAGKALAWQQRKAASFTVSPLHCGSPLLGFRRSQVYGGLNGISLGTAVATSGAAANPNMGYYSAATVTFIMTLFNARLGIWLGNPGKVGGRTFPTFSRSGPRFSSRVIFEEAVGLTDDSHPYVNLSDGGHFENLGLYEMVRRRCRYLVVCDVGRDPSCDFNDLGNALRKVRIDLGIPITFEQGIGVYPKPQGVPPPAARYGAIGTIDYAAVDGPGTPPGTLIYLKPTICRGEEPYDVYNYSKSSPDFPHETTADQWFSESQFESYRALGRAALLAMARGIRGSSHWPPHDFQAFAENVRDYIRGAAAEEG
jgi:hypothetical protein